ncbi:MAG: MFS transporter [Acidimicrobiia bacterium]
MKGPSSGPGQQRAPDDRLLTGAFAVITAAAGAYFIGLGMVAPVLPRYVEDRLGGGGVAVGFAIGAFAVSAALLRPAVGRIGDERGRRVLVVGGTLIVAAATLGYQLGSSLAVLVLMRLIAGVGEAAVFVGAATAAQDLAPPGRRGEATSYFSVAVFGGLGIGPTLGETLRTSWGYGAVWSGSALACVAAAALAWKMAPAPARPGPTGPLRWRRPPAGCGPQVPLLHPAALRPGVVLALSTTGFAGFLTFVPLYVDDLGLDSSGPAFALLAVVVLAVRLAFARLPDQLGPARGGAIALSLQAAGFASMAAIPSVAGFYGAVLVYALGVSLLYPALFPLVVDRAPEEERSQAVATYTLFFDVSQGLGAFVLGVVVALGTERWAFVAAAFLDLVAMAALRRTHALPAPA